MKLILIPLTVLIVLALFAMLGLGQEFQTEQYLSGMSGAYGSEPWLYDSSGTAIAQVSENGTIIPIPSMTGPSWVGSMPNGPAAGAAIFCNDTGSYFLYFDAALEHQVLYTDIQSLVYHHDEVGQRNTFGLSGQNGVFGLIAALMIFGAGVSLRIFGFGIGEEGLSLVLKGTSWGALWAIFSILAFPLVFGTGQMILYIAYFVLTVIFAAGVINSFGSPGND